MIKNNKRFKPNVLPSTLIFLIVLMSMAAFADETVGLFNPSQSRFYLKTINKTSKADITLTYGLAGAGWEPLMGDWNGDGVDTVGLYDPTNGGFHLRNGNSAGVTDIAFSYGPAGAGWEPLTGDWNGDGVDTVGLYDPTNGGFHLRNGNSAGITDIAFSYGPAGSGWVPVSHQLIPVVTAEIGFINDNENSGFDALGSNWTLSTAEHGFLGDNYQFLPAGYESDSATWTFQIDSAGQYKIFAQWPVLENGSPEATYSIINNGTTLGTLQKDQTIDGGRFVELGAFEVQAGALDVVLHGSPLGAVAADAVFVGKGGILQIVNPTENGLETNPNPTLKAVAINFSTGWGVEFVVKNASTGSVVQTANDFDAPFELSIFGLPFAEYIAEVHMVNQLGAPQQAFDKVKFAVGDYYVGIGDSITYGVGDNIISDNVSNDSRNYSDGGGYTPILNDLLTAAKGYPHTVFNEGVPGDKSRNGVRLIDTILAKHPKAKFYLVQYGTNDSHNLSVPSGVGLSPGNSGYEGSFKDNMQQIIDAIIASGKTPILAKLPITLGPGSRTRPFSDPDSAEKNGLIREYNRVIEELISTNGLQTTPPDFYNYFRANPDQMADNLHPDGIGYQGMAELWSNALTGSP